MIRRKWMMWKKIWSLKTKMRWRRSSIWFFWNSIDVPSWVYRWLMKQTKLEDTNRSFRSLLFDFVDVFHVLIIRIEIMKNVWPEKSSMKKICKRVSGATRYCVVKMLDVFKKKNIWTIIYAKARNVFELLFLLQVLSALDILQPPHLDFFQEMYPFYLIDIKFDHSRKVRICMHGVYSICWAYT